MNLILDAGAGTLGFSPGSATVRFTTPLGRQGIGASLVDGLVRIDVARALRSPTGWRVDFYTDAAL